MPEIIVPGEESAVSSRELVITKEELSAAEDKVIKILSKRVKVPGFRPGNVPPSVVKARFGELIQQETLENAINEKIRQELGGARPLGQITVTEIARQEDGSLRVKIEFETVPEIRLPELSRITVEKRVITISDFDVIEQLEAIQKALATVAPVEDRGIREGDTVTAEMTEFDPHGEVTFTGKVAIRYARDELDPYLYDALADKRPGDECDISVVAENEKGENEERKQHYKVISVKEVIMPTLDDEFAKAQGYESLDTMKEDIRKRLEERVDKELENEFEWKVVKAIYDAAPFELPRSLVQRRYESIKDDVKIEAPDGSPVPEEVQKEQIMKLAEDLVKRDLILARIIDEYSIQATEEEVEKEIAEMAAERKMSPEEFRKKAAKSGDLERIAYIARLKKAMEFLKGAVHTEIVFQ
ncbi:MAG: trigger factor [candidate division WOR-3 bacterium]